MSSEGETGSGLKRLKQSEIEIVKTSAYIGAIIDAAHMNVSPDTQLIDHMVRAGGIYPRDRNVQVAMQRMPSSEIRKLIRQSWKRLKLA